MPARPVKLVAPPDPEIRRWSRVLAGAVFDRMVSRMADPHLAGSRAAAVERNAAEYELLAEAIVEELNRR